MPLLTLVLAVLVGMQFPAGQSAGVRRHGRRGVPALHGGFCRRVPGRVAGLHAVDSVDRRGWRVPADGGAECRGALAIAGPRGSLGERTDSNGEWQWHDGESTLNHPTDAAQNPISLEGYAEIRIRGDSRLIPLTCKLRRVRECALQTHDMNKLNFILLKLVRWSGWPLLPLRAVVPADRLHHGWPLRAEPTAGREVGAHLPPHAPCAADRARAGA